MFVFFKKSTTAAGCVSWSDGIWKRPGVGWLKTWTRARYSSLHFVNLHQMQHFSPVSSFTCTGPKAADWFCTLCHLFHLVTPFGVTFSPLCGLCLESTVTSCSVYRAPAPSVFIRFCFFFYKKKKTKLEWWRKGCRFALWLFFYFCVIRFVVCAPWLSRAKLKDEINKDYVNKVL